MYIVDLLPAGERSRYLEVRDFLQSRIRAASIEYWNREEFPFGLLAEMGKYGLGGLQTDGTSALFKGLMYVEVARADVSLSALVGIHNELIVGMIDELGSEEQKQRWLPGLTAFTQLGAFALTEPDHGSDIAGGLETSARLEGGEWVINGAKRWIGAGTIADFALVWARDEADRQIKGFIVETDRPGYSATKISNKIGLRIMQNADIRLDDVRIPEYSWPRSTSPGPMRWNGNSSAGNWRGSSWSSSSWPKFWATPAPPWHSWRSWPGSSRTGSWRWCRPRWRSPPPRGWRGPRWPWGGR
jgi:glutaryl-CoA dehydrogenase